MAGLADHDALVDGHGGVGKRRDGACRARGWTRRSQRACPPPPRGRACPSGSREWASRRPRQDGASRPPRPRRPSVRPPRRSQRPSCRAPSCAPRARPDGGRRRRVAPASPLPNGSSRRPWPTPCSRSPKTQCAPWINQASFFLHFERPGTPDGAAKPKTESDHYGALRRRTAQTRSTPHSTREAGMPKISSCRRSPRTPR